MLIVAVLDIYWYILLAAVIMSWLVAFNVVNPHNRIVGTIGEFLYRATEPVLAPIRRYLPNLGGIDLSPLVVLLILWFLRNVLIENWPR